MGVNMVGTLSLLSKLGPGVIGGMFPSSPHGAVCARVLPFVIEANVVALSRDEAANAAMLDKYIEAARICTGSQSASVADFVAWLQQLCAELGVAGLSAYGMVARLGDGEE